MMIAPRERAQFDVFTNNYQTRTQDIYKMYKSRKLSKKVANWIKIEGWPPLNKPPDTIVP